MEISALVSKRALEIMDLDETVEKEDVVAALCLALGRPGFNGSCRLFTCFREVETAVIQLTKADASRLLQLEKNKNRVGRVPYLRACSSCPGFQVPRLRPRSCGCENLDRKDA